VKRCLLWNREAPSEPFMTRADQTLTGGLRDPDPNQRRQALFSLVALVHWWPNSASIRELRDRVAANRGGLKLS
jgi:hypothetical protein